MLEYVETIKEQGKRFNREGLDGVFTSPESGTPFTAIPSLGTTGSTFV